jgi:hypothetical protein
VHPVRVGGGKFRLPGWTWAGHEPKTMWLCAALIGVFASYLVLNLYVAANREMPDRFGDFLALWSYAKIMVAHPAADLYDFAKLHAAQVNLGMDPDGSAPFPYPPTFLLMLWPLGSVSLYAAYVGWIAGTLVLYICSIATQGRAALVLMSIALLAPTTTINIIAGQNGFLSAALLIGGLRLMDSRPIASGILFGLLTYKPQLGILVPIALVATGQWRCIAAACATLAALITVTAAVFGATIWVTWLQALPAYAAWFDHRTIAQEFRSTLTANLQVFWIPQETTRLIQTAVACLAAALVWVSFRRLPRALAIPVLLAATCLATPHAFIYDLPMLTGAVLLFVVYRLRSNQPFLLPQIGVLMLVLTFPAIMAGSGSQVPVSSVALGLFEMLILLTGRPALLGTGDVPPRRRPVCLSATIYRHNIGRH